MNINILNFKYIIKIMNKIKLYILYTVIRSF